MRVVYGCECEPPPSAGAIDVRVIPPEGVTVTAAEVSGVDWRTQFSMELDPYQMYDQCLPGSGPGPAKAFAGSSRIADSNDLPILEPVDPNVPGTGGLDESDISLRIRYSSAGVEHWATVPVSEVCTATS